jgi:hypothetical protein
MGIHHDVLASCVHYVILWMREDFQKINAKKSKTH